MITPDMASALRAHAKRMGSKESIQSVKQTGNTGSCRVLMPDGDIFELTMTLHSKNEIDVREKKIFGATRK